jgi:hypothetical protein
MLVLLKIYYISIAQAMKLSTEYMILVPQLQFVSVGSWEHVSLQKLLMR